MKLRNGIIFMTALVPTIGHKRLIEFSSDFIESVSGVFGLLYVVVHVRSDEPRITLDRFNSIILEKYKNDRNIIFRVHCDDNAPLNVSSDQDWKYWSDLAKEIVGETPDYLFGSDYYCKEFAERIGAQWIPVDPYREVVSVVGKEVREYLYKSQDKILPRWKEKNSHNIILFGQESVGKSTMAKFLGDFFYTSPCHEWARPYLEMVGPDLSKEKMGNIVLGQIAAERSMKKSIVNVYDTDILSTYGYYKFLDQKYPDQGWLDENFKLIESYVKGNYNKYDRTYVVLPPTNIPFQEDPLRYGGDRRETDISFWVDILEEFGYSYIVASGYFEERLSEIVEYVEDIAGFAEVINFKRSEP